MTCRNVSLGMAILAFLISGCGLDDYEKRMDQQRARLRVFDEENKFLGELLDLPPDRKDGSKAIPFDVFLRLPRGTSKTIADKDGATAVGDITIYRYPGTDGPTVFLAAGLQGTAEQRKEGKGDMPFEDFRDGFRLGLATVLKKYFKAPEKIERLARPAPNYLGDKQPDLEFDYFVLEDNPTVPNPVYLVVYVLPKGSRHAGVAYMVPQSSKTDAAVLQGIDLSARSLDIGDNASRKRAAYSTSKRLD